MERVSKGLEVLITEIVLKATMKVCAGMEGWRIVTIAEQLNQAVVDSVVFQSERKDLKGLLTAQTYVAFKLYNEILDEVEQEIPSVSFIDVRCANVSRADHTLYSKGEWRLNKGLAAPEPEEKWGGLS